MTRRANPVPGTSVASPLLMWSAPGIQPGGEPSGPVSEGRPRSLLRAVAYDSPVLAIRARTRLLKSACLVMIVSRVPSADPQRPLRRAHDRRMTPRPGSGLPFASLGDPAGTGRRRLGADGRLH